MPVCHFCGKEHATEVQTFEDYKNNSKPINLCFKCLALARYCEICNQIVLETTAYHDEEVCPSCLASGDIKVCTFCKKLVKGSLNEHGACKDCATKIKKCPTCNQYHITFVDTVQLDGTHLAICQACMIKFKYEKCPACYRYMPAKMINASAGYCHECLAKSFTCYHCGRVVMCDKAHYIAPDVVVCADCVTTKQCDSCGAYPQGPKPMYNFKLKISDGEYNSYLYLCHNCHKTKNYGIIKRYGYKPAGKFKKHASAEFPALFIGIENEVNFKGTMFPAERVRHIFDENEDHWYIKRDSSVSHGFEVVTHPMNFEYIKDGSFPVNNLFPDGYGIIKSNECGMHIHMSKVAFTNAHLFKFMQFFLNESEFCEKVAERKSNSYCQKLGKEEIVDKSIRKAGGNRNQVNLNPKHTVEIRAFAGVTTPQQYLKNVEFVYALFCFTKLYSIANLRKDKFMEFINKDPVRYSNLIAFLGK